MAPIYKPQVADAIIFPAEKISPREKKNFSGNFLLV
jgi:hypothetical protein